MRSSFLHGIRSKYTRYTTLQKICCWIIGFNIFIGCFAPFIANDNPLFCIVDGRWTFPALHSGLNPSDKTCDFQINALIPWSSGSIDPRSGGYTSPGHRSGNHIHWLGTDALGRDVLAGMLYGTRYAWIIGILSTLIAAIPGIFIGMMIGYWKNDRLRWTVGQGIVLTLWSMFFIYECIVLTWIILPVLKLIVWIISIVLWFFISKILWRWTSAWGRKINVPIDLLIMRGIDIFESFPKILLLMALMTVITRPSILALSVLIALIRWTLFAQIARSETIKESISHYVLAAENINITWYSILTRHIWPNIKSSLLVTLVFTFSASVLLEASLSFIGLGLKLEQVTWGGLMNEGRNYLPGWWLSVFPGMAIFSLLFALNWLFIIQKKADTSMETNLS